MEKTTAEKTSLKGQDGQTKKQQFSTGQDVQMKTPTVSHQDGKTQNRDQDGHEPHLPTPTGQDGQSDSAAAGNVPALDASASTAMDNMTSPTLDAGKGLLSLHHGIDDGLPAIQYELSPQHSMQGRVPGLPDTHR